MNALLVTDAPDTVWILALCASSASLHSVGNDSPIRSRLRARSVSKSLEQSLTEPAL